MSEYRNHNSTKVLCSQHYYKHVSAMTGEDLYSKGEIAEELAFRDMERDRLVAENAELIEVLEKLARLGNEPHYGNSIGNDIARASLAKVKESGK